MDIGEKIEEIIYLGELHHKIRGLVVKEIQNAYKEAGYVKLAEDQSFICLIWAGGRKVELEEEREELRKINKQLDKELPYSNGKFSFQR